MSKFRIVRMRQNLPLPKSGSLSHRGGGVQLTDMPPAIHCLWSRQACLHILSNHNPFLCVDCNHNPFLCVDCKWQHAWPPFMTTPGNDMFFQLPIGVCVGWGPVHVPPPPKYKRACPPQSWLTF